MAEAEKANPPKSVANDEPTAPVSAAPTDSPCDTEELRKAATQLTERASSWTPRTGVMPDFSFEAISALWVHCSELPREAKFLLHVTMDHSIMPSLADIAAREGRPAPAHNDDPLDAKLPGHALFHKEDESLREAAWAWRAALLCTDYPVVIKEASTLIGDERKQFVWDRCLSRFDFVTRDEYMRSGDNSARMGFAMHQWLTDAQIESSVAKALARAVMLGQHWFALGRENLKFPAAETSTLLEDAWLVALGPDEVKVMGRRATLSSPKDGFAREVIPLGGESILPMLFEMLTEEVEQSKQLAETRGETWSGEVLVLAHRDLPWSTVRPVLASMHLAGVTRIAVAGLANDTVMPMRSVVVQDPGVTAPRLTFSEATTVQQMLDAVLASSGPVRLFDGR